MKFSIRFADQIVGTLVILALAILVVVVFMLGKNQRWFVRDYQYKTYFVSATGVSRNMSVQYKGFTIGNVKDISLSEDSRVEVVFTIFEKHVHRVTEGSLVEMQGTPIPGLGNSFVFHPGKGTEVIPEGSIIPEVNSLEARLVLASGLATVSKADDSLTNILNQVTTLLENLNIALAGTVGADELTLGLIVNNVERATYGISKVTEDLSTQLSPLIINLEKFTDKITDPSGAIMGLLDGEGPLYDSVESLAGIIENLNKTTEVIPAMLPQVSVIINELNNSLRSVQDILTSIANNPLLRGGIPEREEIGPAGASTRNYDF
jgi:phospholipid/cholesterol/gamma-HCH transport system substrate-binding protein